MKKIIYKLRSRLFRTCENEVDYSTMKKMLRENSNIIVIDVRTNDEYMYKHLEKAINIPLQEISEKIGRFTGSKDDVIIVYCEYGGRSEKAMNKLKKLGYANVYNLKGGIEAI